MTPTFIQVEREQAKSWLRVLNHCRENLFLKDYVEHIDEASRAIKQALAAPVQEPVAWYYEIDQSKAIAFAPDSDPNIPWQPLYKHPAPVSDPVAWMVYTLDGQSVCVTDNPADFGESHRALPLYTTPPAAPVHQEPEDIAALVEGMEVSIDVSTGDHDSGNRLFGNVTLAQENQGSKHGLILLVQDPEANFKTTTQPAAQRRWVGLTDEERGHLWLASRVASPRYVVFSELIESKLKEKNT